MNFGKAVCAAAAVLLALVSNAGAAEWKKVRIAAEFVYPPFNYIDKGQYAGFDVDIAKALCQHMKVECVWVSQDWDGIIPGLLANKYDAIISSMSITDARKKIIDFTQKYYNTPAHFMAQKGSGISDISPAALKGKAIAVQTSTNQLAFLEAYYKDSDIRTYQTTDDGAADLAAGRVDLAFSDKVLFNEWLKTPAANGCCELVGPDINDPGTLGAGKGVALRKENADLRDMFDKAITEILADGTYKAINDKYFKFSIY